MTFPEISSLVIFLLLLLLVMICFFSPPCSAVFTNPSQPNVCMHICLCVCVWGGLFMVYLPLRFLVRRESRKCDDRLISCETPLSYTRRTNTHICSAGVEQPEAEGFCPCSGIDAFVFRVQRIRLSPPHPLPSFILHLHPCHSWFPSPSHVIGWRFFFWLHLYFFAPHHSHPLIPTSEMIATTPIGCWQNQKKWAANRLSG